VEEHSIGCELIQKVRRTSSQARDSAALVRRQLGDLQEQRGLPLDFLVR